MSCQDLSSIYDLARAWYFLLSVLPINLSRVLFILNILSANLGELLRSRISLVLKANDELPRIISFVLGVSVVSLWPCSCLVYYQLV